jgi:hypothetical protein
VMSLKLVMDYLSAIGSYEVPSRKGVRRKETPVMASSPSDQILVTRASIICTLLYQGIRIIGNTSHSESRLPRGTSPTASSLEAPFSARECSTNASRNKGTRTMEEGCASRQAFRMVRWRQNGQFVNTLFM